MINVNFHPLMIMINIMINRSLLLCQSFIFIIRHSSFVFIIRHSLFVIHHSSLSIAAIVAIHIYVGQVLSLGFSHCQHSSRQASTMEPTRAVVASIHLFVFWVKFLITFEAFIHINWYIAFWFSIQNKAEALAFIGISLPCLHHLFALLRFGCYAGQLEFQLLQLSFQFLFDLFLFLLLGQFTFFFFFGHSFFLSLFFFLDLSLAFFIFFVKYSNASFPDCAFKTYLWIFSDPCLRFRFFSSSVLVTSASFSLSFFTASQIYWAPHLTGIMMAGTVPITVPSSVFNNTFGHTHKTSSPIFGFTLVTRSGSLIRSLFQASVRFLITSSFILFSLFWASFGFSLFRASFWFSLVLALSTGSIAHSTGTAATSAGLNIVLSLFTFPFCMHWDSAHVRSHPSPASESVAPPPILVHLGL